MASVVWPVSVYGLALTVVACSARARLSMASGADNYLQSVPRICDVTSYNSLPDVCITSLCGSTTIARDLSETNKHMTKVTQLGWTQGMTGN